MSNNVLEWHVSSETKLVSTTCVIMERSPVAANFTPKNAPTYEI